MIISDIQTQVVEDQLELSADAVLKTSNGGHFRAWFRFPAGYGPLPVWGDPFLAGFLISCMYAGEEIFVDAPVSHRLLKSIPHIQALISGWYPAFSLIQVRSKTTHSGEGQAASKPTAAFFSGGVDSLYSLLKHRRIIDQLVMLHGFENPVQEKALLETTQKSLQAYGLAFDKKILTVHTNLRAVADQAIAPWGRRYKGIWFGGCYMGSMLAAVGLCLQNRLGSMIIPASYSWETLVPYGSHPQLDPLWSSEKLAFLHDGCEASRLKKIQHIAATAPFALSHVQVCECNLPPLANCCRCDKCLRTMLALRLCGLQQSSTFSHPLELFRIPPAANLKRWRFDYLELLAAAREQGDQEVVAALEKTLKEGFSWQRCRRNGLDALHGIRRSLPSWLGNRLLSEKRSRRW